MYLDQLLLKLSYDVGCNVVFIILCCVIFYIYVSSIWWYPFEYIDGCQFNIFSIRGCNEGKVIIKNL